ncbi:multidrug and toxin extrusion protein 1-like [Liolophura sinensis]|uniref:multidrug and toxin extrusion protein 1-like n=1 Tax=Liolophura sinensis TaxID=3198878 RepID=UPI0031594962
MVTSLPLCVPVYVSSLCCVVSWGLLVNTNEILLVLGQDPLVALYTEEYLYYFMPALLFIFLYQLSARYLQVQGVVHPIVIIGVVCNLINVGLQYVLIYPANLRLKGSAVSQVVAYFCLGFFTILYARLSGAYKGTWGGFSRSSLKDWGQFFKLGLSSIMMICLEWWAFEVGTFLMGILGATELGASTILMTLWGFYSAMSIGIGSAAAYRSGRYLGSMRPLNAITAARVAFCVAWVVAFITAVITLAFKAYIPYLFTTDPDVVSLATDLLPILALFSFFGATRNVCSGIIRGTGNQAVGGITSFVSYFVFGLPIGIPLMFLTSAHASGFWWGLTIGLAINSTSLFTIIYRIDWATEAEKAQIRAKVKASMSRQTSVLDGRDAETSLTSETAALLSSQVTEALNNEISKKRHSDRSGSYGTMSGRYLPSKPPDKPELSKSDKQNWRKLYVIRGITCIVCFGLFAFGIICRVLIFIPPEFPHDVCSNCTTLNITNSTTDWML